MSVATAELEGKVAIVTGAGQGVGRGIAAALAEAGSRVALVGRTLAKVEAVQREIADQGGEALAIGADVAINEDIDRCVAATLEAYGTVDILVNNAISQPLGLLLEVSDDTFDAGYMSGPMATFRFMRACHPYLVGGGAIVNVGSGVALRPSTAGFGCYAAVKEAIRSLTRAAACEWGPVGIRANVIMPLSMSPAMEGFFAALPEVAEEMLGQIPLGRMGDSQQDIGRAVVFLCSDAASYITGITLPVDGGQDYVR
jgi:meso-butanediol dehydrogenase / (S,S)-butanediol dehydrogenase / diacetyl reductase